MHSAPLIDVYTICWNEERMLPYFLRHYGQFARRILELLDGDDAFGFISEVDNHILGVNFEDRALQDFVGRGRSEMAIVVEQILVAFGNRAVLRLILIFGH